MNIANNNDNDIENHMILDYLYDDEYGTLSDFDNNFTEMFESLNNPNLLCCE